MNVEKVISSLICRTYITAKYAGWEYTINHDLQNTFKKILHIKRFKKTIKIVSKWKGNRQISFSNKIHDYERPFYVSW